MLMTKGPQGFESLNFKLLYKATLYVKIGVTKSGNI